MTRTIEVKMLRGDHVAAFILPMPFVNAAKERIGTVTAVSFDGDYTVGTVQLDDAVDPESLRPQKVGVDLTQAVRIDYRNHRGERSIRDVVPRRLWFGEASQCACTPGKQWLLDAQNAERTFALKDVLQWGVEA